MVVLPWPSCSSCLILLVLIWPSCSFGPVQTDLSRLICHDLPRLTCRGFLVMAVLPRLFYLISVPAVRFFNVTILSSCPDRFVSALLSPSSLDLAVLSLLSCSDYPVYQSCPICPVPDALSQLLCSCCHNLTDLSALSCLTCPCWLVPAVLSPTTLLKLSCSGCLDTCVLSWFSCPGCPVAAIMFFLSCFCHPLSPVQADLTRQTVRPTCLD
jgi:hypothetical protein